jgi:hypothetical protein
VLVVYWKKEVQVSSEPHRPRGAQPGNQNARKHGYYSKTLTPGQQKLLPSLAGTRGLDREIEIARVRILSILAYDPRNTKLLMRALRSAVRLVRIQETIDSHIREEAKQASETIDQFLTRLSL